MNNRALAALLATALVQGLPALAAAPVTVPPQLTAKIIHVDDGDTVVALTANHDRLRIRLASIDAPETGHGNCRPGQPWSTQAKNRLAALVLGKTVPLHCYDTDHYGRAVCDVLVPGGTANHTLVAEGLAWANQAAGKRYVRDTEVVRTEGAARAARAGLWQDGGATAPWIWRRTEWMGPQPGCTRTSSRG